ncbi:hypothetical protein OTU49_004882, partial [Cherax quadricarinatus]
QYRGHGVTECVLVTTAHWARLTVVARETCVVGRGSEGTIMAEVRPESVDSDDDFVYVTEAGLEQAPRPEEKGLQVPSQSPPLKLQVRVRVMKGMTALMDGCWLRKTLTTTTSSPTSATSHNNTPAHLFKAYNIKNIFSLASAVTKIY